MEGLIGAGRHERTGERLTYRNGFRDRTLDGQHPRSPTRITSTEVVENPTPVGRWA